MPRLHLADGFLSSASAWSLAACLALFASACAAPSGLVVDVRTDFVPITEFDTVRVRLLDASGVVRTASAHAADPRASYLDGARVAELGDVSGAEASLDVALLTDAGEVVIERRVLVTLRGGLQAVTVLFTRDCRGVSCGDATSACFNARCVDPRCSDEEPEACGDALCDVDTDCSGGTPCAPATCRAGACLEVPDDALCAVDESCAPGLGCVRPDDACPVLSVIERDGGTLATDEAWPAAEYVLLDTLVVPAGVTLRVAACSVIRVPDGGSINVDGALRLEGEAGREVRVTGSSEDAPAGSWTQLVVRSGVVPSVLSHAVIEGGGRDAAAVSVRSGGQLEMHDSTISRSRGTGLSVDGGSQLTRFVDNVLRDNGDLGLDVGADVVGSLGTGTYGPNAREGILVRGGTLAEDTTWRELGTPYVINGSIQVTTTTGTARLVVEAGVDLRMESGVSFTASANGGIALAGTDAAPVTVRSARPVPSPGDWGRFELGATSISTANVFEHAVLEHGGAGERAMVWVRSGAGWSAEQSAFRESADLGIVVEGDLDALTDCELTGNLRGPIQLVPASAASIHGGVFTPNAIEGILVASGSLGVDATWEDHGVPYVLATQLNVTAPTGSARLTLAAGVVVAMPRFGNLNVGTNGGLTMLGTATSPVRITSSSPAAAPGDWANVWLEAGSIAPYNDLQHAIIEYGNHGGSGALRLSAGASVTLTDVTFRSNADGCDLRAETTSVVTAVRSPYACP